MANDINSVVLVGRLTRDAELKYTTTGIAVCKCSLAVNRRKRSGDSWEDEVSFFDVVMWGKMGESVSRYLEKGKQISVSGELRQSRWEQDGQTRSRVEIVASNVQLLGGSPGQAGGQPYSAPPGAHSSGYQQGGQGRTGQPGNSFGQKSGFDQKSVDEYPFSGPEQFDDDIPF